MAAGQINERSLRHAIYAFRDFAADRSGMPSQQNAWSDRLIKFYLNMYRARALYEKSGNQAMDGMFQVLPCVLMELVDMNECPCLPASGCTFRKSTYPIPETVGSIIAVNSVTGHLTFDYVRWMDYPLHITSRFPAQRTAPMYTIKNINNEPYLYVYNKGELEAVAITAVFVDPVEVAQFPNCGQEQPYLCNPLDKEFVCDEELKMKVFLLTYEHLSKTRSQSSDIRNNDADGTSSQLPPK